MISKLVFRPFFLKISALFIVIILLAWACLTFVHLYHFYVPYNDNIAYMGPSLSSRGFWDLKGFFMGDFLDFDKAWGIYFPANFYIYNFIFEIIGRSPEAAVGIMLVFWLLTALLTGALTWSLTHSYWLSGGAILLVLGDRGFFGAASMQRMEILSGFLFLAGIVLITQNMKVSVSPNFLKSVAAATVFALSAAGHPVLFALQAALSFLILAAIVLSMFNKETCAVLRNFWPLPVGTALGGAAVAVWFAAQPLALHQFLVHSSSVQGSFAWGASFLEALRRLSPLFTSHVLYAGTFLVGIVLLRKILTSKNRPTPQDDSEKTILFFTLFVAANLFLNEFFRNEYYQILTFPMVVAVVFWGISRWGPGLFGKYARTGTFAVLLVLIAAHSAWLPARTLKYIQAGCPNLRKELRQILETLPSCNTLLIPWNLYEAAIFQSKHDKVLFSTTPLEFQNDLRFSYEEKVFQMLKPGDIVILSSDSRQNPRDPKIGDHLDSHFFEQTGEFSHLIPGRVPWGYSLTVLTRK